MPRSCWSPSHSPLSVAPVCHTESSKRFHPYLTCHSPALPPSSPPHCSVLCAFPRSRSMIYSPYSTRSCAPGTLCPLCLVLPPCFLFPSLSILFFLLHILPIYLIINSPHSSPQFSSFPAYFVNVLYISFYTFTSPHTTHVMILRIISAHETSLAEFFPPPSVLFTPFSSPNSSCTLCSLHQASLTTLFPPFPQLLGSHTLYRHQHSPFSAHHSSLLNTPPPPSILLTHDRFIVFFPLTLFPIAVLHFPMVSSPFSQRHTLSPLLVRSSTYYISFTPHAPFTPFC